MPRARWLLAKAALLVAWAWLYMFIAVIAGMSAAHSEPGTPTWPFTVFIVSAGLGWLYITYRLIRRWTRHYRGRFSSAGCAASGRAQGMMVVMLTGGHHEIHLRGWRRVAFHFVSIPAVSNALSWFDCSVPGTRGRLRKVFEPWCWRQG